MFLLGPKYKNFRDEVRKFVQKELEPNASLIDKAGKFPLEIMKKLGGKGYLGIPFSKEYGGLGLDNLSYVIAAEEISRACASTGLSFCVHISLGSYPIYRFGTENQKMKYLTKLTTGEYLAALGITEPNAGSDVPAIETTVQKTKNGYILNGSKRFITSAEYAQVIVVAATFDKSLGSKGITTFIVEKDYPGFFIGKKEEKLGLLGSNTVELYFEGCFVPKENLLGEEFGGYKILMETLDGGRISIGAFSLGIAQGAYDYALLRAKKQAECGMQNTEYGMKVIADIATEIEAARLLVYQAAQLKDLGKRADKESAMAKLFASEVVVRTTSRVIDLYEERGLSKDFPLERFYRDAKLAEIGEGTSEIMRLIIAKEILKHE